MRIHSLHAREIIATNAKKTVEVEIETDKGIVRASVPIGTSKGKYEPTYLPTESAVNKIQIVKRKFTSQEFSHQKEVDNLLKDIDGTSNFRELGGNTSLAISSAFLKAFALDGGKDLFQFVAEEFETTPKIPKPISIVAGGWKGTSDIQEFHFLPVHQESFHDSISKISEAYIKLGELFAKSDKSFRYSKNLESGWSTSLNFEKILELMGNIADKNFLKIGLDFAASQIWNGERYVYSSGESLTTAEQLNFVEKILKTFPVLYVEDPFHQEDFITFATLTQLVQPKIVCGDDLYATQVNRLYYGGNAKSTNAILIKPSQVGTISDTVEAIKEAQREGMSTVFSHRSAETDDTLIAHLAVGLGCDYVKFGIAGERTVKINELLRIEDKLKL